MAGEGKIRKGWHVLRNDGPKTLVDRAVPYILRRFTDIALRHYLSWKFGTDPAALKRLLEEKDGERPVFVDLMSEIDNGDVFYDVGANSGTYTGLAATTIDDGTVVAFEPDSQVVAELRKQMAGLELTSELKVMNCALSDAEGETDYYPSSHAIGVDQAESGDEPRTVVQRRGDTLTTEGKIPPPDVLKVDVDGAELRVLKGLEETLVSTSCLLYLEVHTPIAKWEHDIENHGGSISELADLLDELGFDVQILHSRWNNYFIKARSR